MKGIIKKGVDIRSIILCFIASMILEIPILICAVLSSIMLIYIVFTVLMIVTSIALLLIYYSTKREIHFYCDEIVIFKTCNEINRFLWHEIRVEYCGIDSFITLEPLSIKITYFNSERNSYDYIYIPSKKKVFYEIMSLAKQ